MIDDLMSIPLKPHRYPDSCYDDHFCLKPPAMLWVALLYLGRSVALLCANAVGRFAGVDEAALASLHAFWSPEALIPAAIIVPVFLAMLWRSPTAPPAVRRIWQNGRIIMLAAAGVDGLLCVRALLAHSTQETELVQTLGGLCVDVYLLAYIVFSRHVRDSFAEFP